MKRLPALLLVLLLPAAAGAAAFEARTTHGLALTPDGTRLLAVTEGTATVTYTPPATPATEVLVLALDNNEGGSGLEIGRLPLIVRSAP